jgi:hypothetical protein
MYDTEAVITYNDDSLLFTQEDMDELNDREKQFVRDVVYRQEILNIFCIDVEDFDLHKDIDIKRLHKIIVELLPILNKSEQLIECIREISTQIYMNPDEELGLITLYSYDYMYLMHKCVVEYLKTRTIAERNYNELKGKINKV